MVAVTGQACSGRGVRNETYLQMAELVSQVDRSETLKVDGTWLDVVLQNLVQMRFILRRVALIMFIKISV